MLPFFNKWIKKICTPPPPRLSKIVVNSPCPFPNNLRSPEKTSVPPPPPPPPAVYIMNAAYELKRSGTEMDERSNKGEGQ